MSEESVLVPDITRNSLRIDKNIAEHSLDWKSIFGEDWELCFDILVYIIHLDQQDLFNTGVIDLEKLCKRLGHNKDNLQRLHENPEQKQNTKSISFDELPRQEKFMTKFENSLFKLGKHNLPLTSVFFDEKSGEHIVTTRFIQLLTEINIHITKQNKIYYSYKKSEALDYNIARYFFLADYEHIRMMRKNNCLSLYYYLKNIENFKLPQFKESNFEKLYTLAELELNKNKPRDTKLRLKKKLELLKDYIKYDYSEFNVSGSYKYGFQFTFLNNFNPEERKLTDIVNLEKAFCDYVDLKVLELYRSIFKIKTRLLDEDKYKVWFFDHTQNMVEKLEIYYKSYSLLNKQKISNVRKSKEKDAMMFFTKKHTSGS
jgi:hypothetical protein